MTWRTKLDARQGVFSAEITEHRTGLWDYELFIDCVPEREDDETRRSIHLDVAWSEADAKSEVCALLRAILHELKSSCDINRWGSKGRLLSIRTFCVLVESRSVGVFWDICHGDTRIDCGYARSIDTGKEAAISKVREFVCDIREMLKRMQ